MLRLREGGPSPGCTPGTCVPTPGSRAVPSLWAGIVLDDEAEQWEAHSHLVLWPAGISSKVPLSSFLMVYLVPVQQVPLDSQTHENPYGQVTLPWGRGEPTTELEKKVGQTTQRQPGAPRCV